jgi:hypothetical protein
MLEPLARGSALCAASPGFSVRLGLERATNKPPADAEREARLILDGVQSALAEAA